MWIGAGAPRARGIMVGLMQGLTTRVRARDQEKMSVPAERREGPKPAAAAVVVTCPKCVRRCSPEGCVMCARQVRRDARRVEQVLHEVRHASQVVRSELTTYLMHAITAATPENQPRCTVTTAALASRGIEQKLLRIEFFHMRDH